MPFWALESASRGAGLFIALGWSGQWNATFNSSALRCVRGSVFLFLRRFHSRGLCLRPCLPWLSGCLSLAAAKTAPAGAEEDVDHADNEQGGGCAALPRPKAPCPVGWWASNGVCEQGCPLGAQGRDPRGGRCFCGKAAPDSKCGTGLSCVAGLCCSPPPAPPGPPVEVRATASLEGASFVLLPGAPPTFLSARDSGTKCDHGHQHTPPL